MEEGAGAAWSCEEGQREAGAPGWVAGLERNKTERLGGAWAWGLGSPERPPFPFSSLQLLWSPWSPLGHGGSCLPRRLGSLASFSAVTASRKLLCKPWGMEVQSEE